MKYLVTIRRSVFQEREFEVEADSLEEAENEAIDQAINTVWDVASAEPEYEVLGSEEWSEG